MHSEEKVISVIVYTVLVNYPLDVAASFIFILGFNSVQFVPETGLAGSTSIILGGVSGFFLFFMVLTHSLFCCPSLSAKHVLSLTSLGNIVYN